MFQVLPPENDPQNQASKCANNQAERTAVGQGFSLCFIYHCGPNLSQLKARSHKNTLQQWKCLSARGRLSHPHVLCHLLTVPAHCQAGVGHPLLALTQSGFGISPLLAREMAIKAHACFLFHLVVGLEQWKVIYAGKELYKENDATNAVPTKMGMGKGREFTAHRSVKQLVLVKSSIELWFLILCKGQKCHFMAHSFPMERTTYLGKL